ncbi:FabD/lysophospholipase-like protein [Myriangium duriaei CBS 260.36]|uniref:FabD/lysophospholipase-like protein n=1 Tax=Myriangium duriaei CBS 260.36 TaxID=1168546 RepID=A0A9P4MMD1_9PEZI|nr:FabD/lysophospholipase-like protein [Myriangium duriaei CBS 260.36]
MSLYDAESTLERLSSDKHRDTTNWILDAEPFKEWLDRPIVEPGKTICTVAVFESLKESPATSQRQVYQFFYEAAMWDHYTGLDLLEALVKQMVLTNPDIRSDLHDRTWRYYGPQSNRPHLAQLGKYLFLPLARQLKNPIFVVDGIDESETSRAEIVQLLSAAADEGASVFINARKQIRFEPALKNVRLVSAVQKKLFPSVWPRPIVGCSAEEASSPITAVVKSPIDPLDDYTHLINTAGLCLLSIDGGGARGLSPLYLLKAIMDQLNEQRARLAQPRVRPCDVFDLIGGTSTGGLIAIMLGRLEMDVDECITAYRLLAESVFGVAARRSSTGEIRAKSDSKALDEAIQRMIIGKDQAVDCAFDDGCRRGCKTFVCALDAFTQHITRFRTYSLPEEISLQSTVREAALATFATTSLILPVKVNRWSFAGGRVVADNPLNEVEGEASAIWCPMTADLKPLVKCIVSIGAGHPGLHPVEDSPRRSPSNVLVASETEHTAEVFCARWARHYNEGRYFRFSVEHGLQHRSLTEYFEPGLVKDATKHYMSHTTQRRRIGDCIRNLGTKESYTPLDIAERIRRSLH